MISSRFPRSNMEFKNSRFHSDTDPIVRRRVVRSVYRGGGNGAIPHPRLLKRRGAFFGENEKLDKFK